MLNSIHSEIVVLKDRIQFTLLTQPLSVLNEFLFHQIFWCAIIRLSHSESRATTQFPQGQYVCPLRACPKWQKVALKLPWRCNVTCEREVALSL